MHPMDQRQQRRSAALASVALAITAIVLTLSLQFALTVAPAFAADDDNLTAITRGAALFRANCAGCHGGGMNFIKEKKTLQKAALEKYLGGNDPIRISDFVQKGMPHKLLPFSKEFGDQDYSDVASYVSDQALGEKW